MIPCAKDLEGDLIINNGAELTIQCEVSLPKGAKIIVKPRGKLVLDGAHITNNRYAIECWFFAQSAYPEEQIPLIF